MIGLILNKGDYIMYTNILKELLNDEGVISLDLLLVTGDVINISDGIKIDDEKSVLINEEENNIINLNHVVKVDIHTQEDIDREIDFFKNWTF